jgi:hypothetical protein
MTQLELKGNVLTVVGCSMFILVPIITFIIAKKNIKLSLLIFVSLLISIIGFVVFMYGIAYKDNRTKLNMSETIGAILGGVLSYLFIIHMIDYLYFGTKK